MDASQYMERNGYLPRNTNAQSVRERARLMSHCNRERVKGRVAHQTCNACGTAYDAQHDECPWCGERSDG